MTEYRFFVEYIEDGTKCSDIWTEWCLLHEIRKGEVEIIGIMPLSSPEE